MYSYFRLILSTEPACEPAPRKDEKLEAEPLGGKVNDYSDGLLKLNSLFGGVFKKRLGLFMMT